MIEPVARLRIPLADIRPAFGREDRHAFGFRIGGKVNGAPTPGDAIVGRKVSRARNLRRATVIEHGFDRDCGVGGGRCREVVIESVSRGDGGTGCPALVDAARRAPPEEPGGPPGCAGFTMADPADSHHAGLRRRHGAVFDPGAPGRHRIEVEIATFRCRAPQGHPSRKGET